MYIKMYIFNLYKDTFSGDDELTKQFEEKLDVSGIDKLAKK